MNRNMLDYLMSKVERGRDMRRGDFNGGSGDMRDMNNSRDRERNRGNVEFQGNMDFNNQGYGPMDGSPYLNHWNEDMMHDSRRGMRSMGRRDGTDHHSVPQLTKSDMMRWKQMMRNADGTQGPHYDMQQVMNAAQKIELDFERHDIDEKEFCMAMNMMYSDYCKVARRFVSPDKEMMFFAEMAKAFLCDPDGPEPAEKLALYYNFIVDAQSL